VTDAIPARVALLADPASKRRGVGPEAAERLLAAWLGHPVVLGHREDGSPLITGAEGHHISLGHAVGVTAIALADQPVGIDIAAVAMTPADRRVASALFTAPERAWLDALSKDQRPAGFVQLWTLKEALMKRERQAMDTHELPDLSALLPGLAVRPVSVDVPWRPWAPLDGLPSAAGLMLAMPAAALIPVAVGALAVAHISASTGPLGLALAWTLYPAPVTVAVGQRE